MLSSKFVKFIKSFKSNDISDLDCGVELGRLGIRIAQEYSTRFDLLPIDKCLYLAEFQTPSIEKAEKHLLNLVPKFDPLFSLMEYYDNYPYMYSDINYTFKACLKSGVEISIKAVNPTAKNNYFKKVNALQNKLKYIAFFHPWVQEYKIREILEEVEKNSAQKASLSNEINYTNSLNEYLKAYKDILHLEDVRFPKIYAYMSSENMVVSEYTYGTYFYEMLQFNKLKYEDVLKLVKAQLFFMLKIGVFYNNLHSGNLLYSEEGKIYYLDCNTLGSLTSDTKIQLFRLFKAVALGNYPYASVILNELSDLSLGTPQLEELSATIKEIFATDKEEYKEAFFIKIMKSFRAASKLGMTFESEIYPIFKCLVYLDSLIFKTKSKNSKIKSDILQILEDIEGILKDNNPLT